MLVAPSEPRLLKALGKVSSLAERHGADFMWSARPVGLVGVQRKEFPGDFLSSVDDDRLSASLAQMQALDIGVLLLEGRGTWTTDGQLVHSFGQPWSRSQHRRYLASVQAMGIWVTTTDGLDDTKAYLTDLVAWSRKPNHTATRRRGGKIKRDGWGRLSDRDFAIRFMQGIPGVGPEKAALVFDGLGRCPFRLDVTEERLREIHGIGRVVAQRFVRPFAGAEDVDIVTREAK